MRKNKFLTMLLLGVMAVSFLASCDDDEPQDVGAEKDKLETYITKHEWFLHSIRQVAKSQELLIDVDGDGKPDKNLDERKECQKDNFTKFNENGTFIENSFNDACSEYGEKAHSIVSSGEWKINGNKLFLELSENEIEEYEISYDYTNESSYNGATKVMELIKTVKINDTNIKVYFTYANKPMANN